MLGWLFLILASIGHRATGECEPRQVREEAAVSIPVCVVVYSNTIPGGGQPGSSRFDKRCTARDFFVFGCPRVLSLYSHMDRPKHLIPMGPTKNKKATLIINVAFQGIWRSLCCLAQAASSKHYQTDKAGEEQSIGPGNGHLTRFDAFAKHQVKSVILTIDIPA